MGRVNTLSDKKKTVVLFYHASEGFKHLIMQLDGLTNQNLTAFKLNCNLIIKNTAQVNSQA